MTIWDDLTAEERVVLVNAIEEAPLNGLIADFLGHAEHGSSVWMFSTDHDAIAALVPRFTDIVKDMIRRDLVELVPSEQHLDWPNIPRMTDAQVQAALADRETWLASSPMGPFILMTTDHTDRLRGRWTHDYRPRPLPPQDHHET